MDEFTELARAAARASAAMRAGLLNFRSRCTENAALFLTGEGHRAFNSILIGAHPEPARFLEECLTLARERQCPFTAFFAPHVAESLAADALRLGLSPIGQMPLMTLRRTSAFAGTDGRTIERATDRVLIGKIVALLAREMDLPVDPCLRVFDPATLAVRGMEMFVAARDGTVVSTVTMIQTDGVAGIWAMATASEHRRRGHGRALLTTAIDSCLERGISRFYLHASEAGRPLYESLGFETVGHYSLWMG